MDYDQIKSVFLDASINSGAFSVDYPWFWEMWNTTDLFLDEIFDFWFVL